MKTIRNFLSIILISTILFSCKKENAEPEQWQFTKLVNANLNNSGNFQSLDFYQKKGNQWRILQFEPDDFTKFDFKNDSAITPTAFQLPTNNSNAFMTSNVRLFDSNTNQVHFPNKLKWLSGEPVGFNDDFLFTDGFPDMPAKYNSISKFSGATYSREQTYDNNPANDTYIFYDFPNQKYVYYGFRTGVDLIIENTLPLMCTDCNGTDWKNIDAVTCTNDATESIYYFFDFDARKMYILFRIDKNTNHPSFSSDILTMSFDEAFKGKWTSPDRDKPFDFSK